MQLVATTVSLSKSEDTTIDEGRVKKLLQSMTPAEKEHLQALVPVLVKFLENQTNGAGANNKKAKTK